MSQGWDSEGEKTFSLRRGRRSAFREDTQNFLVRLELMCREHERPVDHVEEEDERRSEVEVLLDAICQQQIA